MRLFKHSSTAHTGIGKAGNLIYFKQNNETHAMIYNNSPRSNTSVSQVTTKSMWTNPVQFYKSFDGALRKSFQYVTGKQTSFNLFMRNAMQSAAPVFQTKEDAERKGCVLYPYMISEGSLDKIELTPLNNGYVTNISLGSLTITADTTVGEFSTAIKQSNKKNQAKYRFAYETDWLTLYVATQYVDSDTNVPYIEVDSYKIHINDSLTTKLWDVMPSNFFCSSNGYLSVTSLPEGMGFAFVHTRKADTAQKVSTQYMVVNNPLISAYTSTTALNKALKSYGAKDPDYMWTGGEDEPTPETRYTQTVSVAEGMEAMGSVSGGGSYAEGTEITIHAVANSGYTFKGWKLNGGSTYESTEADYTYEVEADNTFVAEFQAEAAQVTLTVGQDTNPNWGDIQIDDRTAAKTDTITVAAGTEVTIKAIAATGYSFSSWTDGNTSATRTITVTENKTVNASFESR